MIITVPLELPCHIPLVTYSSRVFTRPLLPQGIHTAFLSCVTSGKSLLCMPLFLHPCDDIIISSCNMYSVQITVTLIMIINVDLVSIMCQAPFRPPTRLHVLSSLQHSHL